MTTKRTVVLRTTSFSVEAGEAAVGARPATVASDDKDKLARVVAPLPEWWRSGRAADRRLARARRPNGLGLPTTVKVAARGSLSAPASRLGRPPHARGSRRYSFERLAAIIAPARLSTETRLERRGPLVATVAGTGRAWRKVTIRPRCSS